MTRTIPMPRLGELTESVVLTRWLCAVGDKVEAGQPIAEVETDKIEMELVCPASGSGRIVRFFAHDGDEVEVGAALYEVEP